MADGVKQNGRADGVTGGGMLSDSDGRADGVTNQKKKDGRLADK